MTDRPAHAVRRALAAWPARHAAEVASLVVLALLEPTITDLAASPHTFQMLAMTTRDVVVAALVAVTAAVALVLMAEAIANRFSQLARNTMHVVVLASLAVVWAVQVAHVVLHSSGIAAAVAAVAAGTLMIVVLHRWRSALLYLACASIAPLAMSIARVEPLPAVGVDELLRAEDEIVVQEPTPIVIVVFDALPLVNVLDGRGAIDSALYPELASLAAQSTWYRNHVTVGLSTQIVTPVLVSGSFEGSGRAFSNAPNILRNIDRSYIVQSDEPVSFLCLTRCASVARPRDRFGSLLRLSSRFLWARLTSVRDAEPGGPVVDQIEGLPLTTSLASVPRARSFIDSLAPLHGQVAYLHVMLPHPPYVWNDNCDRYEEVPSPSNELVTQADADRSRQGLLLQLVCADRILGELRDQLEAQGLFDDALVVVVADHGESAVVGGATRVLRHENAHELLWTPLLIKAPGQRAGEVSDELVRSTDVLPLVLEQLGAEAPWLDGIELPTDGAPAGQVRVHVDKSAEGFEVDDGWVELETEELFGRVLQAGPWGGGEDRERSLYALGAYHHLAGRELASITEGDAMEALRVEGLERLGSTENGVRSLAVWGEVPVAEAKAVVLVDDGVIVATADITDHPVDRRFWIRAPGSTSEGRATLHVVTGPPAAPTLHQVTT
jgi:hypothetical protein